MSCRHVLRSCCRTKPKPPPGDYDMKILPFVPLRRGVLLVGPTGRTILCLVDVSFREVVSGVAEEHWRVAIDQRESSQETLGKRKLRQNSEWFVVCGWWSLTWSRRIAVLGEAAVDEAHNSFIGKGCNHPTFENSMVFVVLFRCIGGSQRAMMFFMYWYTEKVVDEFGGLTTPFGSKLKHVSPVLDS